MKNYKKILSLVILSLVLISTLSFTCVANGSDSLSEDYQSITYNGKYYIAIPQNVNCAMVFSYSDVEYDVEANLYMNEKQEKIIDKIYCSEHYNINGNLDILVVEFYFKNSFNIKSVTYLEQSVYDEFARLYNGNTDTAYVKIPFDDTYYNIGSTTVEVNYANLKKGHMYEMEAFNLNNYEYMYVYFSNSTKELSVVGGILVFEESNGKYYYLDYKINNIKPEEKPDTVFNDGFKVNEVSDKDIIAALEEAKNTNIDDDFDDDFDVDFGNYSTFAVVMVVLAAFVFGFVPLVVAIICFIKAPKLEAPYRELIRAIAILCAIVTFFVLLILLFLML